MLSDEKVDKRHKLYKIGIDLALFLKQRTAATHAYAILISPEDRKRKPYTLPVQLIPHVGMGQENIRKVLNNVILKMKEMSLASRLQVRTCTERVIIILYSYTIHARITRNCFIGQW